MQEYLFNLTEMQDAISQAYYAAVHEYGTDARYYNVEMSMLDTRYRIIQKLIENKTKEDIDEVF